jgi:uncharacterized membrane protein
MFIGMLLIWLLVIVLAVWLARELFGNAFAQDTAELLGPREIAARRYARGEISQAEFERMLKDLG